MWHLAHKRFTAYRLYNDFRNHLTEGFTPAREIMEFIASCRAARAGQGPHRAGGCIMRDWSCSDDLQWHLAQGLYAFWEGVRRAFLAMRDDGIRVEIPQFESYFEGDE